MERIISTYVGGNGLPIRVYENYAEHNITNNDEIYTLKIPKRCIKFCRRIDTLLNDIRCTYRKNGKFTIYYYNPNDLNDSTTIVGKWFPGVKYAITINKENPHYIDLTPCEMLYQNLLNMKR
jgi:hypothetical protein